MSNTNKLSYNKAKERGLKRKITLIQMMGGKCSECGYDENVAALEFHHIDPSNKKMQLDMRHLSNNSEEVLIEEAQKCIVLCSNCHKKIHYPDLQKENLSKLFEDIKKEHEELSAIKESGSICPICGERFLKVTGKKYCSKKCRLMAEQKLDDEIVIKEYKLLNSQVKTANYFGVSRRVIRTILKRNGLAK